MVEDGEDGPLVDIAGEGGEEAVEQHGVGIADFGGVCEAPFGFDKAL
jgi:hypothetical protein